MGVQEEENREKEVEKILQETVTEIFLNFGCAGSLFLCGLFFSLVVVSRDCPLVPVHRLLISLTYPVVENGL